MQMDLRLDMSGQDLSGAKLKDVNFWDANLNQGKSCWCRINSRQFL
jgi:uncharacterized protein YjbI with pentapeptide repeats